MKVLTEFMEGQDTANNAPDIPPPILMAIIELTQFLNENDKEEEESIDENEETMEPSLSPNQKRLRDQILKQKEKQAEEIANILNAEAIESFMRTEEKTTTPAAPVREDFTPRPFPARISLPEQGQEDQPAHPRSQFSFDTLPVL